MSLWSGCQIHHVIVCGLITVSFVSVAVPVKFSRIQNRTVATSASSFNHTLFFKILFNNVLSSALETWKSFPLKFSRLRFPWRGRYSIVGIATRYGLDGLGIESRCGRDFPHPSRPTQGPNQSPAQWVPGLSRR
jgi:hypothetical protein